MKTVAKRMAVIGVALFVIEALASSISLLLYVVKKLNEQDAKALAAEADLDTEFKLIKPMPDVRVPELYRYRASHKSSPPSAIVGEYYSSPAHYNEIRNYYDTELSRNGWAFHSEKPIRDWGRDLGGMTARYCKGTFELSIHFAGQRADYGWNYAVDIIWPQAECK